MAIGMTLNCGLTSAVFSSKQKWSSPGHTHELMAPVSVHRYTIGGRIKLNVRCDKIRHVFTGINRCVSYRVFCPTAVP